jgi:serine/threonine-protein kinase
MVTRKGQLKVLDFGLARLAAEANLPHLPEATPTADRAVTTPSLVLGTPDYLSPEQAKNAHDVDIRADIYSLGCVLYFLLTGRPPFARFGAGIEKMLAHVQDDPEPVRRLRPDVPEPVAAIVARMMAKDPADRFATPGEVAAAVKPYTKADAPIDDRPDFVDPPAPPATAVATMAIAGAKTDPATPRPARRRPRRPAKARRPWPLIAGGVVAGVAALAVGLILAFGDRGRGGGAPEKGGAQPAAGESVAGNRILFVVPHQGLHYRQYEPTRRRLAAAQVDVVTASTDLSECGLTFAPPGSRVVPDRLVTEVNPRDYDGVLFCGQRIWLHFLKDPKPPAYQAVRRIIDEMRAANKVIGGIEEGQMFLKLAGLITGPQMVGVGTNGRVITGAKADDAPAFADAVLAALAK